MRFAYLVVLVLGCGGGEGGSDPDIAVVELGNAAQVNLCEQFLDGICESPEFDDFCTDPCLSTSCQLAADDGHIVTQCDLGPDDGPILVGDVEASAEAADFATCAQGGGCMFDALEAACP